MTLLNCKCRGSGVVWLLTYILMSGAHADHWASLFSLHVIGPNTWRIANGSCSVSGLYRIARGGRGYQAVFNVVRPCPRDVLVRIKVLVSRTQAEFWSTILAFNVICPHAGDIILVRPLAKFLSDGEFWSGAVHVPKSVVN